MGKDGKRPSALIIFAKVALNIDSIINGKTISLVGAIFDNIVLIVAPMVCNRASLITLGNFVQLPIECSAWGVAWLFYVIIFRNNLSPDQ